MTTKIILTVKSKLKAKYGTNFANLENLLDSLIISDKTKGITTNIVYIDDATDAGIYGFTALAGEAEKDVKAIFDQVYTKKTPEYMVIFGAQDIFPFQNIVNLAYKAGSDDDQLIPSDLPYACNSPYSTDCNDFTNPARVIGRIPDIPGGSDFAYVKKVINNIINSAPADPAHHQNYLAVSASVWMASTKQSIKNIFGNNTALQSAPPAVAGSYTAPQLGALSHFFNCHGALNTTSYYGQSGTTYPHSLDAINLNGKVTYGTVVAAECCYGAQLLEVATYGISIANNYLLNNALSFMGSSTIAYGPASGQGLADLICQYFLINVNHGASCGRAMLDAWQKFISVSGPTLDPYELKTLAQFYILGDPSVQPVQALQTHDIMNTIKNRRLNLAIKGANLGFTTAITTKVEGPALEEYPQLSEVLKTAGFESTVEKMVFEVNQPGLGELSLVKSLVAKSILPAVPKIRFHVFQKGGKEENGVYAIKVLVVKESDQQVLGWKKYESR